MMYDKTTSHFQYLPATNHHHQQPLSNKPPSINQYTPNTSSTLHISSIPQHYQSQPPIESNQQIPSSDLHFRQPIHLPQNDIQPQQPLHQALSHQLPYQHQHYHPLPQPLSHPTTQYNHISISSHPQTLMQQQSTTIPPQQGLQSSENLSTSMNLNSTSNPNSSNSNRRGPWSPLEDKKLLELISLYGPTNWVRISNKLESRTPKQCRERYHQNLKPSLNRAPISPEEGELIEKLVAQYGKKWAEISRHLNGRSDNAIKNWWNGGANRRRRASLATSTSQNSIISENNERKFSDDDDSKLKIASNLPQPPQQPPQSGSTIMSASSSLNHQIPQPPSQQQQQIPNTHHLPQISFNTSMFGNQNENNLPKLGNTSSNIPSSNILSNHSPLKPSNFRSASFDMNSNTLPPISQSNKRRLIDDQFNRRHSSAHSMLIQAHSNGSHSNLNHSSGSQQSQSGNVSPSYHGSPLMLGNSQSRNNSISHFELINNNNNNLSTNNSSRRSSSIAPEFFPNTMKSTDHHLHHLQQQHQNSQHNQHFHQSQASATTTTHKRNFSQNSSFNSPSLTPSTRFSVSSTNSILNPNLSVTNTSSSILTSPSHSYYKNEFNSSNTSINKVKELNEENLSFEKRNIGKDEEENNNNINKHNDGNKDNDNDDDDDDDGNRSNSHETEIQDITSSQNNEKAPKVKMSVSSLLD
ncbi:uncharacterized protein KGF55_001734 [Candida pseudojiufengensis]|uniref:uncharacterized protein n=1 Tax=Candida pseudojiufengensis TaxID=497109 RepID=UPI002225706E|nr:uncharacterized protein KGF55_001734 [Candida pseudojiufengensis]KAI5964665.1 hypothetical protein KGF55_001734 [Candida pseudojiufengensis]